MRPAPHAEEAWPPRLRDVALGWLTAPDAGHVGLIQAAAAAGLGGVSLKLIPGAGDPVPPVVGDRPLERAIADALAAAGLALLAMGGVWLRPDTRVGDLLPGLDIGARLGARHLVVVGADPVRGRLRDNLALLAAAARERDLGLAIEFAAYTEIPTLADAVGLAGGVGLPNCGVLADALHLDRSGGCPADLQAVQPGRLLIAQVCDAPAPRPGTGEALRAEARGRRLSPGEGALPLEAFLRALPPGTPIEIEVPAADLAPLPPAERVARIAAATARVLDRARGERG